MNNEANETIFGNWSKWIAEEVDKILCAELEHKPYDSLRSQEYISAVSQQIIDRLTATNKNFKYIVHVTLVAHGGNGLDIGGLSFWNPDMDGSVNVKWEGKFLSCIATVYGIAN